MPDYRASWYSQLPAFGWVDREDRPGSNALGVPDFQQGIALPSRRTLGQWFNVTAPGGQSYRLQQTDVGPATWTGRGVDISAAAAHQMGYTPRTFPTDASFTVEPAEGGSMPDMPQGRRNMPSNSLMDMLQPQQPQSFADRLGGMSNSLIGLGMGLLQPYNPWAGTNAWSNALRGYQAGAAADQEAAQNAWRRSLAERQFAESNLTDFQKMQRDIARFAGTPQAEDVKKFYAAKLGETPQLVSVEDPNSPGDKLSLLFNPRAPAGQQFTDLQGRPFNLPATAGGGGGPGGVGYFGTGPFGTGTTPAAPSTAAPPAAGAAAPPLPAWVQALPPSKDRREIVKQAAIEAAKREVGGPSTHEQTAIDAADQAVVTNRQVIGNLQYAKRISPNAPSGLLAPTSDVVGQAFPGIMSNETKNRLLLQNAVIGNAVEQLKAIFGGNPSEGERKILLDMQGSVNQPDAIRQQVYDRAIEAANNRLVMNQQKAEQIRGRTYYQPGGGQQAPAAAGGGVRRYNPETGRIE